ncbi:cytochrome-c peroxidase [Arenibacterium sp. LLYu02]|uniref:cytochrome-c peroxidase n=1 Tax=Arenibacterium sp. LLYu02 TaxID=3404132 RepID=UPI003B2260E7
MRLKAILTGLTAVFVLGGGTYRMELPEFARPARIPFPDEAPYSPQKAALGKMLFFDARLSGAQNLSCASCHNPSFGWETPVPHAIGARRTPLARHTPTVENLAESHLFFWDGRADSLEEQALGPITHPDEMNSSLAEVVDRLAGISGYRTYFDIAFPDEGLAPASVLEALATYQRTLRSGWSPFDNWVEGDEDALSPAAKRGFGVFIGAGGCRDCHSGWAFTDHALHPSIVPSDTPGETAPSQTEEGMFKTPGLRNIALRAPYMHNGSLATLHDVVEHYRRLATPAFQDDPSGASLSDREASDLIAFLQSLTAYEPHVTAPALPVD